VVISNFNLVRVSFAPSKAYSPLVVDSDAVLSVAVPLEFLEAISRRHTKILQRFRGIKQSQLAEGDPLKFACESLDLFAFKELFRILIGETPDHRPIVTPGANNVKR
jgi:hypothetical protein